MKEQNTQPLTYRELIIGIVLLELSSALSIFGSASIIFIVLKQNTWRTSVFQRIMFGLSLSDLFWSVGNMIHPFIIPASTNLLYAAGNDVTCNIAGFLGLFLINPSLHSCFLAAYFFLAITRNLSERTIGEKLEPWIHIVPWVLPLLFSTVVLVLDKFRVSAFTACVINTESTGVPILILRVIISATVCIPVLLGIVFTWQVYQTVRRQNKRNDVYEFDRTSRQSQRHKRIKAVGMQAIFYSVDFFQYVSCDCVVSNFASGDWQNGQRTVGNPRLVFAIEHTASPPEFSQLAGVRSPQTSLVETSSSGTILVVGLSTSAVGSPSPNRERQLLGERCP